MIHKIQYTSREEWLALRDKMEGFGGSDIGAVLGLSTWATPYSVWARKTGRIAPLEDNERLRQGRDLEGYVAQRFSELTGKSVHNVNAILQNDAYPRLFATIDRKVSNEDAGLECKTTSGFASKRFRGGEFPANYYAQCVAYLAVSGLTTWYLAALVLGEEFKVYVITRDEKMEKPEWAESIVRVGDDEIAALNDAANGFWDEFFAEGSEKKDVGPSPDGRKPTGDAINEIYRTASRKDIDLSMVEEKLLAREEIEERIKDLKQESDRLKQEVELFMGDADYGQSEKMKVSWKESTRTTFDKKAISKYFKGDIPEEFFNTSVSRTMRVSKRK